ncbi:MAG: hypothetical protein IT228_05210 [Flavobacteriales bacterium]|nr:hypothetical protein [Flavobacteriales bacterium]NUQ15638.1 hypothetical protein [Flavobacteriales bacterium]
MNSANTLFPTGSKVLAMAVAMVLCSITSTAQAQNLVPNGSFEEYLTCPEFFGQWALVEGWTSPYTLSSDYFNACSAGVISGVPLNQFGYQLPFDGDGYMGLATYAQGDPDYREIIATELLQPLQVGVPVCVSMKVACGGFVAASANSAAWKARGPGLRFFVNLPTDWGALLYPNDAAIHMDTVLADTANWVDVSGTFVPDSAYRFLAITNFFADSLSWPEVQDIDGGFPLAYAFVDDVRVSEDLAYCGSNVGVVEHGVMGAQVTWDVFGSVVTIRSDEPVLPSARIDLRNGQGQLVRQVQWPRGASQVVLSTGDLAAGFYVLTYGGSRGAARSIRLVHSTP